MYEYIVGKINYTNTNYVILENNFIGYKVFVNGIDNLDLNAFHRLYLYTRVTQNNKGNFVYEYYGFKTINEKFFFELLLTLNGIGPKTAMAILKNDVSLLKKLIKSNDIKTLETLPGFTNKLSIMIVNQLGYKLRNEIIDNKNSTINSQENDSLDNNWMEKIPDIVNSLKVLGYKKQDIEYALNELENNSNTNNGLDINDLVSEAIKTIINKNGHTTIKAN
ncbi:Holliday junction branch migration protein RuvA [Malacoplasma muris]|uniref:Holliday junction branch migration protein RuvA n=1 Tax=Malacoplasma muris TaxID=2119 RepID=UPI00398E8AE6